jgi:hypothetical protein
MSRALPRQRWSSFLIRPQTLLRWHRELVRRKWTYHHASAGGRPAIATEVRELILRRGRENPRWGCLRIKGALAKLGVRVSATAIRTLLRRHGLGPAPRRSGPTWSQVLRGQARGVLAADLLHRGDGVAAHAVRVLRHRGPHQVRACGRSDQASRYGVGDPTGPEPLLRPVRAWAVPAPDPRSRRQVPKELRRGLRSRPHPRGAHPVSSPAGERVGARYSVTSCDLRILMDQPTKSISAHDPPSR